MDSLNPDPSLFRQRLLTLVRLIKLSNGDVYMIDREKRFFVTYRDCTFRSHLRVFSTVLFTFVTGRSLKPTVASFKIGHRPFVSS